MPLNVKELLEKQKDKENEYLNLLFEKEVELDGHRQEMKISKE